MKKAIVYLALFGLGLGGCGATDRDYAGRNNADYARAECLKVARGNGYSDVAVDSIERDGRLNGKSGCE